MPSRAFNFAQQLRQLAAGTISAQGDVSLGANSADTVSINGAVNTHIIPATDVTYDLGSVTKRFKDLYISGSTIDLGGAKISQDSDSGTIALVAAPTLANPSPTALVVTASGGTVAVATSNGSLNLNAVAAAVSNSTGFDGNFSSLANTPTTLAGYGITDALSYDSNLQGFVNTFTLPTSDGSNNQVLITDGSGTLSFANQSGGSPTLAGLADVTTVSPSNGQILRYASANSTFYYDDDTTIDAASISTTANGTQTTFTSPLSSNDPLDVLVTIDGVLQTPNTDYTISGTTVTTDSAPYENSIVVIRNTGVVVRSNNVPGITSYTELSDKPTIPVVGTDALAYDSNLQGFVNTFTLPTSDGSNNQVLVTDGSGTLSFADQSGGGGGGITTGKAIAMAIVFG